MDKPTIHTSEYYDYHEVIKYIEDKYKIQTRDYLGSMKQYSTLFKQICEEMNIDYSVMHGKTKDEEILKLRKIVSQEHRKRELPYLDFWHWLIDKYQINNGSNFTLYFKESLEENDEYCPKWVKEILTLINDEFQPKNGEMDFHVWW